METKKPSLETNPVESYGTAPNLAQLIQQNDYSGKLLKDRYLIEGELGRGGIGVVYLARDTKLMQRRVVIKVLLDSSEGSLHTPWLRKKFEQEVEALARIDHPGVVGVLDVGEMPDGKPFFVMQFVEGFTLRAVMERTKLKDDPARIAHIIRQVGLALTAAHDKGIIHRDLKPENVMVQQGADGEEVVKLIDFGIASVRDSQTNQNDTGKTKVAGALPYMAPEQLRGEPKPASDTWALGVMAFEIVTDRMPFEAETMVVLHEQQRKDPAHLLDQLRTVVSEAAAHTIIRALSFEPERRYARARDFGDALSEALLNGLPRAIPTGVSTKPSAPTLIDHAEKLPDAPKTTIAPEPLRPVTPIQQFDDDQTGLLVTQTKPTNTKLWLALAGCLLLAVIGAIAFYPRATPSTPATSEITPPLTPAKPSRTLSYSLSVKTKKNAGGEPIEMAGEIIFSPGDELRFKLISPQDGFLYVIGEGPQPDPKSGLPLYNLLFPSPTAATAQINASQMVYLPSEKGPGFFVDKEMGSEKIWLVWSQSAVTELDALRRWYNNKDKGAINDASETQKLRDYLSGNIAAKPVAEKDSKQMTLKGGLSELLIYPIELAHY